MHARTRIARGKKTKNNAFSEPEIKVQFSEAGAHHENWAWDTPSEMTEKLRIKQGIASSAIKRE